MLRITVQTLGTTLLLAVIASRAECQSLDGVWEISAVIDNGRVVEPAEILRNYAADGRITIRGQQVEIVVPTVFQTKRLPFVVDASQSPMTVDLAGAEKTGGRGILIASKDTLLLCLSGRSQGRPTAFASNPGTGNLLVTLRRATATAPPAGQPPAAPTYKDDVLRRMLVGTWGHQDDDSIHYLTFNNDGSVNTTTTWKDQFKQLFHQDVRSKGKWTAHDGVVTVTIDSSTDGERRGQSGSFRVRSITGSELVAVDFDGRVRQKWKAPQ